MKVDYVRYFEFNVLNTLVHKAPRRACFLIKLPYLVKMDDTNIVMVNVAINFKPWHYGWHCPCVCHFKIILRTALD